MVVSRAPRSPSPTVPGEHEASATSRRPGAGLGLVGRLPGDAVSSTPFCGRSRRRYRAGGSVGDEGVLPHVCPMGSAEGGEGGLVRGGRLPPSSLALPGRCSRQHVSDARASGQTSHPWLHDLDQSTKTTHEIPSLTPATPPPTRSHGPEHTIALELPRLAEQGMRCIASTPHVPPRSSPRIMR